MNARRWLGLGILIVLVVGVVLASGRLGASSSVLSRGASGWLAARRYLEAREQRVEIVARRLDAAPAEGVLVLAFPLQRRLSSEEQDALQWHLANGGTLLVAYSGTALSPTHVAERETLDSLWLQLEEVRGSPPLVPWKWWAFESEQWSLESDPEVLPGASRLVISAPRSVPRPLRRVRVLYLHEPSDVPLVFSYRLHRGQVLVLPAEVLSNAWILEPGNADLLETLAGWLGPVWSFDEYHHGLTDPALVEEERTGLVWELFGGHLLLLYLLAVVALGRRFGPVWREGRVASGSAALFLRNLGALHRRLGHQDEASRLLLERARDLHPRIRLPEETSARRGLTELARKVSRAQRRQQP